MSSQAGTERGTWRRLPRRPVAFAAAAAAAIGVVALALATATLVSLFRGAGSVDATPSAIDFGVQDVGRPGAARTVTLTNDGGNVVIDSDSIRRAPEPETPTRQEET